MKTALKRKTGIFAVAMFSICFGTQQNLEGQVTPMRIPVVAPRPVLRVTTNKPVYFECRNDELYRIDLEGLQKKYREAPLGRTITATNLEWLAGVNIGDDFYSVDLNSYMLRALMLQPRKHAHGEDAEKILQPGSVFQSAIKQLDPAGSHIVFFVRPNGSNIFEMAESSAKAAGFRTGYMPLRADDPLTFTGIQSP